MAIFVENVVFSALFSFVGVCGYYTINFIAIHLENPFGDDITDLPMQLHQQDFNNRLRLLIDVGDGEHYRFCSGCKTDPTKPLAPPPVKAQSPEATTSRSITEMVPAFDLGSFASSFKIPTAFPNWPPNPCVVEDRMTCRHLNNNTKRNNSRLVKSTTKDESQQKGSRGPVNVHALLLLELNNPQSDIHHIDTSGIHRKGIWNPSDPNKWG